MLLADFEAGRDAALAADFTGEADFATALPADFTAEADFAAAFPADFTGEADFATDLIGDVEDFAAAAFLAGALDVRDDFVPDLAVAVAADRVARAVPRASEVPVGDVCGFLVPMILATRSCPTARPP